MSKPAGMLPPFAIQSEETRAMARHCSTGIEPRISTERIILLDTQVIISSFLNLWLCLFSIASAVLLCYLMVCGISSFICASFFFLSL